MKLKKIKKKIAMLPTDKKLKLSTWLDKNLTEVNIKPNEDIIHA